MITSKLQNRIEIYRRSLISTDIGDSFETKLYKKAWADIIPLQSNIRKIDEIINVERKFKILMRKIDIVKTDFIIYKNLKFEIDYIVDNFNRRGYIEIYANLVD